MYYAGDCPGTTSTTAGDDSRNILGLQHRNCAYSIVADDPMREERVAMGTRGISWHAYTWRAGTLAGGSGGG